MLRFVADEDFTRVIVRGVLRARSDIDLVRAQDVGLRMQEDAVVLNWAATEGRVLLTHDVQTMPAHAYERVEACFRCQGCLSSRKMKRSVGLSKI